MPKGYARTKLSKNLTLNLGKRVNCNFQGIIGSIREKAKLLSTMEPTIFPNMVLLVHIGKKINEGHA